MTNKPELRAELKRLKNAKALLEKRIGQVTAELKNSDRDPFIPEWRGIPDDTSKPVCHPRAIEVYGGLRDEYPTERELNACDRKRTMADAIDDVYANGEGWRLYPTEAEMDDMYNEVTR